ncbi:MAG TPA: response regulator [Pirellulales bacterium]|jgi:FixJ family two-component response regulator|nr:response regulator [Pirellulales bacterium]
MPSERVPTVFIVDDDSDVRETLCLMFRNAGFECESYASGEEFLAAYGPNWSGCIVLDLRLDDKMTGLEVQAELTALGARTPVIVLSAYADVSTTVKAVRCGAIDVLEKPFDTAALLNRVRVAIEEDTGARGHESLLAARMASLSQRQREVMRLLIAGKRTKEIARQLAISPKTVEKHRANVLVKMRVESVVDLMRLVMESRN